LQKKCLALLGTNGSAKAQKVLLPCQMYKNAVYQGTAENMLSLPWLYYV
jgi:hypothetical protein